MPIFLLKVVELLLPILWLPFCYGLFIYLNDFAFTEKPSPAMLLLAAEDCGRPDAELLTLLSCLKEPIVFQFYFAISVFLAVGKISVCTFVLFWV